ncbi:MAG: plasmid pRiA4b ORF-3 family protein [Gammaproteobacteria bacterium]|nr:plasmid pRiA4b ORF-3 family protein [Gammaproteobacteria bacterium]
MSAKQASVLRFDVRLRGIEPPIWRSFEIREQASFWDLHVAIQDALGWLDCHLHEFTPEGPRTRHGVRIGIPDDDFGADVLPGWEESVRLYFHTPGVRMLYTYDFGDDWQHDVELVSIEPRVTGTRYPRCIAGERACPPEDCGGPHGYLDLLHALKDPTHPEHEQMLAWTSGGRRGKRFDPEAFDPGAVKFSNATRRLRRMLEGG